MRALRYQAYGPVADTVRWTEVARPDPGHGEVRVRVHFASLNPLDWKLVEGQFRVFAKSRPPAGIGTEFAGTIDALGANVAGPAAGTLVFGFIDPFRRPPGALQEFVVLPAQNVVPVPPGVDAAAAATLPVAAVSALQMCRSAHVGAGMRVLVHGAAGGVGSYAVQVVRALGAAAVATGSRASEAYLATLGADAQLDYAQPLERWGGPFDAVLDCASTLAPREAAAVLARGGHYVSTLPRLPGVVLDPLVNSFRRVKRHTLRLAARRADLDVLLRWMQDGRVRAAIGGILPASRAVEALARSKDGHVRGKLVVEFA